MGVMKSILVVDDAADCREAISTLLADAGYDTIQASDGLEALAILSQIMVDLLITDIVMPNMNGIELSGETRCRYPKMKCILMSGDGAQIFDGKEHGLKNNIKEIIGPEYFIKKPCDPASLIKLVDHVLG